MREWMGRVGSSHLGEMARGGRFKPKMSPEELNHRTNIAVGELGLDSFSQAKYIKGCADEILKNSSLSILHPSVNIRDNESWYAAFEFVMQFLIENSMELTLDMVREEFMGKKMPEAAGTFEEISLEDYWNGLFTDIATLQETSFKDRVDEFLK